MPELRALRRIDDAGPTPTEHRDLEAETARKIRMLVLQAKLWVPNRNARDAEAAAL